ncbi:MAG: lipid kinase YegS [Acidobacteria bacterium]|nr:MAG: lipid kinase YegS [Acidobacteriota bacterium]
MMKTVRVILNGKGAANPQVRAAVNRIRDEGQPMEVRCTWEGGDAAHFAQEAIGDGIEVLVAGGGDGTIHEVVNGLMTAQSRPELALGVLPLGTANDFARGCGIPLEPYEALKLAIGGAPVAIDVPSANGVFFANVASGGFGAEVTVGTPSELKRAIGGGAYALVGIVTAAKMTPYSGNFTAAGESGKGSFIALAVGNARQAGGGFQVTPKALLDDGLLDLMILADFQTKDLGLVLNEFQDFANTNNRFVHFRQAPGFEMEIPGKLPINLDGEPYRWDRIHFEVRPKALLVVLPEGCPLIRGG